MLRSRMGGYGPGLSSVISTSITFTPVGPGKADSDQFRYGLGAMTGTHVVGGNGGAHEELRSGEKL